MNVLDSRPCNYPTFIWTSSKPALIISRPIHEFPRNPPKYLPALRKIFFPFARPPERDFYLLALNTWLPLPTRPNSSNTAVHSFHGEPHRHATAPNFESVPEKENSFPLLFDPRPDEFPATTTTKFLSWVSIYCTCNCGTRNRCTCRRITIRVFVEPDLFRLRHWFRPPCFPNPDWTASVSDHLFRVLDQTAWKLDPDWFPQRSQRVALEYVVRAFDFALAIPALPWPPRVFVSSPAIKY